MKNTLLLLLSACFLTNHSFGQARLMMTGSSYVVIDNAAKVVIENPNTDAITNSGSGGIMTESEFDQVLWKIGANAGTYVMPFVSQAPITQIPFTAIFNAAGTGAGQVFFSTYPGSTWDNNVYRPSDVTHMFDYNTNTVNNSDNVIDRFWIIDAQGYGTKPNATFSFTYRDQEHTQIGNNIVEADLGAQRFHPGPNIWGDYLPQGTTNTAANITSGVPVVPADFWRSWTLSETTSPLYSNVIYFKGTCDNGLVRFQWQVENEKDLSHYEIEMYQNGNFVSIGTISPQSGNSIKNYAFASSSIRNGVFRLVEVDYNQVRTVKSEIETNCSSDSEASVYFNNSDNSLNLIFDADYQENQTLYMYDAGGKIVFQTNIAVDKGTNTIKVGGLDFQSGIYFVRMALGNQYVNQRLFKTNN